MNIRRATSADLPAMVDLSEQKRTHYERFQPLFWRKAKDARERQLPFFEAQLQNEHLVMLVNESVGQIDGFIIANLRSGRKCDVDDFVVSDANTWLTTGQALLRAAGAAAKERGIAKYEVVCGHLDRPKQAMLTQAGLTLETYWFTAAIQVLAPPNGVAQVRRAVAEDALRLAEIAGQPGRAFGEITHENSIVLVCEQNNTINGYASAIVIPTPPVYDPGGPTCLVLETVMAQAAQWAVAGPALWQEVQNAAAQQGAVQYVVICAASDHAKQAALFAAGLTIASEWYEGAI